MKHYKKIGIIIGIITIIIPFFINEFYKTGKGYVTLWEAKDVLAFYGSYVSFIGTVLLGILALYQNKIFKEENDKSQLKLEKINSKMFDIEEKREKEKLFELYFSYIEEATKLFNPENIIGRPEESKNIENIYFSIKSIHMNTLNLKRKLLFLDNKNSDNLFFEYVETIKTEMTNMVLKNSDKSKFYKDIVKFWSINQKSFDEQSVVFIKEIHESIFEELIIE